MEDDPKTIEVLDGLEAIRRRPERYVGALDATLPNRLLVEALCCARDEAVVGDCTHIEITLGANGRAIVRDDGMGLPLCGKPGQARTAERYLTMLLACAASKAHLSSETTCTMGLAVLNALCGEMQLRIFADGAEWMQRYERGTPTTTLEVIGTTRLRGTELSFSLHDSLPLREYDFDALVSWAQVNVREVALTITDTRDARIVTLPRRAA